MFIGTELTHKVFGKGVIIDEIDAENLIDSKIIVEFDTEAKKMALRALADPKLFVEVPADVREVVVTLIEDDEAEKEAYRKSRAFMAKPRPTAVYHNDEHKKEVSIEAWKKAYNVAGDYRFPYESRAVVVDDTLYIHATAACFARGLTDRQSYLAYKACESGKKYDGSKWFYATKEDIESYIPEVK